jgi:hypothetical protein
MSMRSIKPHVGAGSVRSGHANEAAKRLAESESSDFEKKIEKLTSCYISISVSPPASIIDLALSSIPPDLM